MESERNEDILDTNETALSTFDQLYIKYKDAVFGFAVYLTREPSEAEDLFQETWLRIVKNLPENVDLMGIKSWIFTIVTNLHRDNLRKKRVRQMFFLQKRPKLDKRNDECQSSSEITNSVRLDETEEADIGRDINRAIASLPERQRQVFVLKEIAGFKQTEIVDVLGIPLGTVKSLMFRAVRWLQRELSTYDPKREKIKCDAKILSI